GLKDRVVKGLQQARDGDVDGAIETIAERFHDALSELQARQPPQDSGWLRLAARVAYRAGDMRAAADYAQRALDRDEDAATWNLRGRLRIWLKRNHAMAAFRRAPSLDRNRFVIRHRVTPWRDT